MSGQNYEVVGKIRRQKSRLLVTVSTLNDARLKNRSVLAPASVRYRPNLFPYPPFPPPLLSPVIWIQVAG